MRKQDINYIEIYKRKTRSGFFPGIYNCYEKPSEEKRRIYTEICYRSDILPCSTAVVSFSKFVFVTVSRNINNDGYIIDTPSYTHYISDDQYIKERSRAIEKDGRYRDRAVCECYEFIKSIRGEECAAFMLSTISKYNNELVGCDMISSEKSYRDLSRTLQGLVLANLRAYEEEADRREYMADLERDSFYI